MALLWRCFAKGRQEPLPTRKSRKSLRSMSLPHGRLGGSFAGMVASPTDKETNGHNALLGQRRRKTATIVHRLLLLRKIGLRRAPPSLSGTSNQGRSFDVVVSPRFVGHSPHPLCNRRREEREAGIFRGWGAVRTV